MTRRKRGGFRGERKAAQQQQQQKPKMNLPMSMSSDNSNKIRADQIAEGKRMMLIEQLEEMKSKEQK